MYRVKEEAWHAQRAETRELQQCRGARGRNQHLSQAEAIHWRPTLTLGPKTRANLNDLIRYIWATSENHPNLPSIPIRTASMPGWVKKIQNTSCLKVWNFCRWKHEQFKTFFFFNYTAIKSICVIFLYSSFWLLWFNILIWKRAEAVILIFCWLLHDICEPYSG